MNWRKIAAYAAALFVVQFLVGFLDGAFAPTGFSTVLVNSVASLVACGSIFAHLSANQGSKPFAHACAALVLHIAAAFALWQVLAGWFGRLPLASVALEWLVLVCALLVGVAVGSSLRRSTVQPADA
jgi:ABC-type polysaccharide/polyol phosphate export permease